MTATAHIASAVDALEITIGGADYTGNSGAYARLPLALVEVLSAACCCQRLLKYVLMVSRSAMRARCRRVFTVGTEIPRISPVSSVDSPSTSRSRKTVR